MRELILKSLNKAGKTQSAVKSVIWNQIIKTYQEEKNIDITSYLISIELKNNICIISTHKPILNTELQLIEFSLKKNIDQALLGITQEYRNLEFRYK